MSLSSPYRTALLAIAIAGLLLGIVLIVVGEGVWGAVLGGLGLVGLMLWLVVSALTWKPVPEKPSAGTAEQTAAPAGSKLEQIRAALDAQD